MKSFFFFPLLFLVLISEGQKTYTSKASQKSNKKPQTEQILSFHDDIVIDTTGLVRVTEHIKVYANGDIIKRGLLRSIPLYRKDVNGIEKRIDFIITAITKNGQEEPYHTKENRRNSDIYIGDKNTLLSPDVYEYAITYESKGHIGFFKDYDELYWNVTGNGWPFPIKQASATVILPLGAVIKSKDCYTGVIGSKDSACQTSTPNTHTIDFTTTQPLGLKEGLTIAVSWPAGIVQRPVVRKPIVLTHQQKFLLASISFALLFLFYFLTWRRHGKDPVAPVVIPTFTIPHNLSPAAIRYLYRKEIDNKCFSVALIHMAVKGCLKIVNQEGHKKDYEIVRTVDDTPSLSTEEDAIYRGLFSTKTQIAVDDNNYREFKAAKVGLDYCLKEQFKLKDYFLHNRGLIVLSSLLTILIAMTYLFLAEDTVSSFVLFIVLFFFTAGILMLVYCFRSIKKKVFRSIVVGTFGLVLSVTALALAAALLMEFDIVSIVWVIATFIGYTTYLSIIKAPTMEGAATMAKIMGFKMYLETAEENRLNLLNPPNKTPELFEKFLPYAIALDVENKWGEKFSSLLEAANYTPDWYVGPAVCYTYFPYALSNSFSPSLAGAQVNPAPVTSGSSGSFDWSSGSSGGGFSGGGGGGGGGGGW